MLIEISILTFFVVAGIASTAISGKIIQGILVGITSSIITFSAFGVIFNNPSEISRPIYYVAVIGLIIIGIVFSRNNGGRVGKALFYLATLVPIIFLSLFTIGRPELIPTLILIIIGALFIPFIKTDEN